MDRDRIIATLRAHEPELRHRAIRHAALFGSVARGETKASSDIDLLINLDPKAPIGVFESTRAVQDNELCGDGRHLWETAAGEFSDTTKRLKSRMASRLATVMSV
jgi:predicted nucleotidyltransferase